MVSRWQTYIPFFGAQGIKNVQIPECLWNRFPSKWMFPVTSQAHSLIVIVHQGHGFMLLLSRCFGKCCVCMHVCTTRQIQFRFTGRNPTDRKQNHLGKWENMQLVWGDYFRILSLWMHRGLMMEVTLSTSKIWGQVDLTVCMSVKCLMIIFHCQLTI